MSLRLPAFPLPAYSCLHPVSLLTSVCPSLHRLSSLPALACFAPLHPTLSFCFVRSSILRLPALQLPSLPPLAAPLLQAASTCPSSRRGTTSFPAPSQCWTRQGRGGGDLAEGGRAYRAGGLMPRRLELQQRVGSRGREFDARHPGPTPRNTTLGVPHSKLPPLPARPPACPTNLPPACTFAGRRGTSRFPAPTPETHNHSPPPLPSHCPPVDPWQDGMEFLFGLENLKRHQVGGQGVGAASCCARLLLPSLKHTSWKRF